MSANRAPIFIDSIRSELSSFDDTDTTDKIQIFQAGTNSSLVDRIVVSTTQASPNVELNFYLSSNGTDFYRAGTHTLSGATTTDAVDETSIPLFRDDVNGKVISIGSGASLYVAAATTLGTGEEVFIIVTGGDY